MVISQENIERLYSSSRPDRDPRDWVVTVSYLVFISEGSLIAGDDAKGVYWSNPERHGQHITLFYEGVEIISDSKIVTSLGKDTLAFDHSKIIIKTPNRIVDKTEHEPQVLQALGKDFTITEARRVFVESLGVDYHSIDHSNFRKATIQYFEELGEYPVGIGRPSKIYQLKATTGF